jgi:hypothetical protein
MSLGTADQRSALPGVGGLVVLFAAGLLLASSWFVAYPVAVLSAAWLIAFAAMAVVFLFALRESRATGTGIFVAVGRSVKALGQFIWWFF